MEVLLDILDQILQYEVAIAVVALLVSIVYIVKGSMHETRGDAREGGNRELSALSDSPVTQLSGETGQSAALRSPRSSINFSDLRKLAIHDIVGTRTSIQVLGAISTIIYNNRQQEHITMEEYRDSLIRITELTQATLDEGENLLFFYSHCF
jgi:hypothetical protein